MEKALVMAIWNDGDGDSSEEDSEDEVHKFDVPLPEQVMDVDEIGVELTCNEPPRMFVAPV